MGSYYYNPYTSARQQTRSGATMMPSKQTTSKQAQTISEDERLRRNALFDTATSRLNPISRSLESYYGPGGMSEWKKGQTMQRRSDTTRSFDDARAGLRRNARMAGFGYEQPATQAGEQSVENARAGALARIPGDVEAESIPIAQNAAALGTQAAGTMAGIGASYNPLGYYNTAADMTAQDKAISEAEKARRASMWQSLLKTGVGIAGMI